MKVGILGGGQLGRMLALAGYPLGMTFRVFDSTHDACAGQVAPLSVGNFESVRDLERWAADLDVVTYEFENVPVAAARHLAVTRPVFPPDAALQKSQDRLVEKKFLRDHEIPTPEFAAVNSEAELCSAVERLGRPAILKSRTLGYDGKGQYRVQPDDDLARVWEPMAALGGRPFILEQFVGFTREVSILAIRGRDRACSFYPLVENVHRAGILRTSRVPCGVPHLEPQAREYAKSVLDALDYVGVLAIEFFVEDDRRLLANEMAPRVHNSGHWTMDAAMTSQFENHLRAIAGMPLGDCSAPRPCAMVNLIGAIPDTARILAIPGAHLHLYGKDPRPGRKVGHVNVVADDAHQVTERIEMVRRLLPDEPQPPEVRQP